MDLEHYYWQNLSGTPVPHVFIPTHPNSLLAWTDNVLAPNFREERIKTVLTVLRGPSMNMSAADLLAHVISSDSEHKVARSKFMKSSSQVGGLLNLIAQDKDGTKQLDRWLRVNNRAIGIVCDDIDREMDSVKEDMRLPTKDITADAVLEFDFDTQVSGVMQKKAPVLTHILRAAAQGARAAKENVLKTPDLVSFPCLSLSCHVSDGFYLLQRCALSYLPSYVTVGQDARISFNK